MLPVLCVAPIVVRFYVRFSCRLFAVNCCLCVPNIIRFGCVSKTKATLYADPTLLDHANMYVDTVSDILLPFEARAHQGRLESKIDAKFRTF